MTNLIVDLTFESASASPDAFEAFLDRVLEELAKIDVDADVTASLAKYEASFELPLPNSDLEATSTALAALRSALHAADCGTAGWEACFFRGMQTQGVELVTC